MATNFRDGTPQAARCSQSTAAPASYPHSADVNVKKTSALEFILYISGSQLFWHQWLVSWKTIFPRTQRVGEGWDDPSALCLLSHHWSDRRRSSGNNARDGGLAVNTDDASLTHSLLTSCCAAWLLTGHGQVSVRGPGAGDPCTKSKTQTSNSRNLHINLRANSVF